ncbi:MAG: hypothetical protein M3Z36_08855 [Acidobacteriota bacterium]|nr:hypothetical protein [Acidobacteriota bacterium]
MKILERKKYLKKSTAERAFVSKAARPQEDVVGGMVQEFCHTGFQWGGEALALAPYSAQIGILVVAGALVP